MLTEKCSGSANLFIEGVGRAIETFFDLVAGNTANMGYMLYITRYETHCNHGYVRIVQYFSTTAHI